MHCYWPYRGRPLALLLAVPALLAAASGAWAQEGVRVADLEYRTTATARLAGMPMTLHARTATHWQRQGDRYEASMQTDTVEFLQQSSGTIRPDGSLLPATYTEKRPFHSAERVQVDWPAQRVQYAGGATAPTPAVGAQDRLSLQFELAATYARAPERFAPGAVFAVQLIGPHAIDDWKFVCTGREGIQTAQGPAAAVHLAARRPVRDTEETMDLWIAVDAPHLPLRIRMVDRNGAVIDSILQTARYP